MTQHYVDIVAQILRLQALNLVVETYEKAGIDILVYIPH